MLNTNSTGRRIFHRIALAAIAVMAFSATPAADNLWQQDQGTDTDLVETVYDVLTSESPVGFSAAGTCLASDLSTTSTTESSTPAPGEVLYFVVVAETDCGAGTAGSRSNGVERTSRVCR